MSSLFAAAIVVLAASPVQTVESSIEQDAASSLATFTLPNLGQVHVYLPSDMRSGDTISGTVLAVPHGTNEQERQKNADMLSGYVVLLPDKEQPAKNSQPSFLVPAALAGAMLTISLLTPDGKPAAKVECPVQPPVPNSWKKLEIPRVGTAGRPIEINGPFDGSLANTSATFNGQPMAVLAESPRGCIVLPPSSHVGPGEIGCSEGPISAKAPYNNLQLRLTTAKPRLLAGESATVSIQVSGLAGLKEEDYPIPCEVTNLSPEVIRVEGFSGTVRSFAIQFGEAKAGAWNLNLAVTGMVPGSFLLKGVLFATSVHDIKKNLDKASFNNLLDAIIAKHEAEIAKIDAEEKAAKDAEKPWPNSPSEKGRQMKRDLLKATVEKLKLAKDVADTDLGAGKAIADKALADLSAVQLGAELVSFAAEMLGYTDVPVPGVGAALKGLKALSKSKKVLELIEGAEKALDAYDKAKDVAEKAEKLKELKQKVEQVKEALGK